MNKRLLNIVGMYLLSATIVAAAVPFVPVNNADEPVLLRVRVAKGNAFRYILMSTTSQDMTVEMNDITNESTSSLTVTMVVNDAALDRADITTTFSDVTSSVRVRGMEELGVARDTTVRLTQFEGASIRLTMDQFGRASKVSTSLDGTASAFFSSMKILDRFSAYLPKEPISVGGSWTLENIDTTAAPSGSGDVRTTAVTVYTYRGIRDTLGTRCWVIDATSSSLTQEGEITANGIDLELEGSGQSQGTTFLDVSNGMVVATRGMVAMQTQMSLSGQQSMVIPVATQMQFTMTRITERR